MNQKIKIFLKLFFVLVIFTFSFKVFAEFKTSKQALIGNNILSSSPWTEITGTPGIIYPNNIGRKIGIGTNNPKDKLNVAGNITISQGGFLMFNLYLDGSIKYINNGYGSLIRLNHGSGNLEFATAPENISGDNVSILPNTKLVITSEGKVGIGTAMPYSKLEVAGGDIRTLTAGNGFIVKSPNGSLCKKIGIDNSGNIIATSVSCQ